LIIEALVEFCNVSKEGLILITGIIDEDYQQNDGNIDSDIYPELFGT